MTQICPTVTAEDAAAFQSQLSLVTGFAERIHIDLMDGDFAPSRSPSLAEVSVNTDKAVDVHVMYRNPQSITEDIVALQPNLVVVHAEADIDIPLFATNMRQNNIKVGIALLPETSVADVAYILPHVQHLLIFGGHLGYHGGAADLTQLNKVADARKIARHLEYGWDGGANESNVGAIKQAGIQVINVGGCIHNSDDPAQKFLQLQKQITD